MLSSCHPGSEFSVLAGGNEHAAVAEFFVHEDAVLPNTIIWALPSGPLETERITRLLACRNSGSGLQCLVASHEPARHVAPSRCQSGLEGHPSS